VSVPSGNGERGDSTAPGALQGTTIAGKYGVQRLLGVGGMGEVYLALQQPLDREVAVKVLRPPSDSGIDREQFERMFLEEAAAAAGLKSPHTVTVFDYGRTAAGVPYLIMDYLEGQTIEELLEDGESIPLSRAVHIGIQVCRALREAHEQGIVHRDLKPANVILSDRDNDPDFASVLDFGLVGALLDAPNEDGSVRFMGSPRYAAPEQFRGSGANDQRTDIYSFGLLLYAMVAAHSPYSGDTTEQIHGHLEKEPPPFDPGDAEIPEALDSLIRRCLEKDPEDRYQSMTDVIRALSEVEIPDDEDEPEITAHDLAEFARELELDDDTDEMEVLTEPPVSDDSGSGSRTVTVIVAVLGVLLLLAVGIVALGMIGLVTVPWGSDSQDPAAATAPDTAPVDPATPAVTGEPEPGADEPGVDEPGADEPPTDATTPPSTASEEPPHTGTPRPPVERPTPAPAVEPPPEPVSVPPVTEPPPVEPEAPTEGEEAPQLNGYKEDPY